ncbi:MAG: hypothetical protein HYZ25_14270 [Chloroflexi bacterium]|nr:hypothetical protein [Chloroflexota bacterium]
MNEYTFELILKNDQIPPRELEKSAVAFETEAAKNFGDIHRSREAPSKDIDPLAFATLSIAIAPIVATKFFEFLNTWALRRENRNIRIKIQVGKDESIEFEGSETLSKQDVEEWIEAIARAMKKRRK